MPTDTKSYEKFNYSLEQIHVKIKKHQEDKKFKSEVTKGDKIDKMNRMKIDEFTTQNCFHLIPVKKEKKAKKVFKSLTA